MSAVNVSCFVQSQWLLYFAVLSLGLPGEEAPQALEEHVRKIAEAMVG